ncbi:MAG: type II toxin-antitoxin system HicB family antitoxin [Lachnospiraceae bacterium]|nr:type II toxin-antitoxin system HicB family antitoxin [Lachnospiraceae bacterium]
MKPTGYEVIIWWSTEDGHYIAEVPELKGCTAGGTSLTDVAKAVEESIDAWIADCRARGQEIPAPRGRLLYA